MITYRTGLGDVSDAIAGANVVGTLVFLAALVGLYMYGRDNKPDRQSTRKEYVDYVGKAHKLSAREKKWLMEHEE